MPEIVRFHQVGEPEVSRIEEETSKHPGKGEVRLEEQAVSLNWGGIDLSSGASTSLVVRSGGMTRLPGRRCYPYGRLSHGLNHGARRGEKRESTDPSCSEGNVSKVDRILDRACSSTRQAARDKEISINKAEKWSRQTEAQQTENLRILRIERGIRKKARNLVARLVVQPDEGVLTTAHLQRLLQRVSTMSPEQSKAFGPVVFGCLHVPGKAIYVTDELVRAFEPQQEVLIE
jgi:hypothetical protein